MKKLLLLPLLFVVSCRTTDSSQTTKQEQSWAGKMQGLAADVKALLPYLYDRAAFEAPENREKVQGYLTHFAKGVHSINPEVVKGLQSEDPLVGFSLETLKQDLERANSSYQRGQFEYARYVTKSSMAHCFRCHSVAQGGSSAPWDLDSVHDLKLAPLEKADLLVATRKYDKAIKFMEGYLNSDDYLKESPFDYESLLRRYLALMIRIEDNPGRALTEIKTIAKNKNTPHYIAEQIEGWSRSLEQWIQEKSRPKKAGKGVIQSANDRFKQARKIQQFEKDHAGDVEYLRATSILHEGLKSIRSESEQAQAFYMLGNAYEVLDELGSWNLHESYYEMCIRTAPQAPISKKCLSRLEASILMGYSGSSGTNIPTEERQRLEQLKEKVNR